MFIWNWIAMAAKGEPYEDLEAVVAGLPQRGFNAVRVDAGLNWCFDTAGRPRGEMEFGPWIKGYRRNLTSQNGIGGGRHDVLQRVIRLLGLARQYGVYVILTSWEYQDSSWLVADPAIRAEVMDVPEAERFMLLARQHDRLLTVLKREGFSENIAFVEIHNEPDYSQLPRGDQHKKLHAEAIDFLRRAHDDILVSGDYSSHDPSVVPDNIQVYDQHVYAGAPLYNEALYRQTVMHEDFDPANPRRNRLLDRLLKDPFVPYEQFVASAQNVRDFWRRIGWLYYNLDNARFDEWISEQFQRDRAMLEQRARTMMADDATEAARRIIPAVLDEGGYFFPPLESTFELTQPGLSLFELMADLAVQHDYWGFMPTTYCGPEHPLWKNVQWLRDTNGRFLSGTLG